MKFQRVYPGADWMAMMAKRGIDLETLEVYLTDDCVSVIRSIDDTPHGKLLHVSISMPDEKVYPTREQIRECKDRFFGDVTAIMVFPRKEFYINYRKNCFHLFELPKIPGPTGDWEVKS